MGELPESDFIVICLKICIGMIWLCVYISSDQKSPAFVGGATWDWQQVFVDVRVPLNMHCLLHRCWGLGGRERYRGTGVFLLEKEALFLVCPLPPTSHHHRHHTHKCLPVLLPVAHGYSCYQLVYDYKINFYFKHLKKEKANSYNPEITNKRCISS